MINRGNLTEGGGNLYYRYPLKMNPQRQWNHLGKIVCILGLLILTTKFATASPVQNLPSMASGSNHKQSSIMRTGVSALSGIKHAPSYQWLTDKPQEPKAKRWLDLFGGSSVETRFPLPSRRQFPEVDWRGFNEDIFHESFGDFNPVKRWGEHKIRKTNN